MLIINCLWRFVISRHSLAATFLRKLKAKELTTNDSAGSVSVSELNRCGRIWGRTFLRFLRDLREKKEKIRIFAP